MECCFPICLSSFSFFFFFPNIAAVGFLKLIRMTWKLYQALFMFSRIPNKSSSWDEMHTILSRHSVEQNCKCRFLSWIVSYLHHYIINFSSLPSYRAEQPLFLTSFFLTTSLCSAFELVCSEICPNSSFRFYCNHILENSTDFMK